MLVVRGEELWPDAANFGHLNSLTPNTELTDICICDSGCLFHIVVPRDQDETIERRRGGVWDGVEEAGCGFAVPHTLVSSSTPALIILARCRAWLSPIIDTDLNGSLSLIFSASYSFLFWIF
ncbi:hypothetical protein J6590_099887 [Homalodisca vitripennis]|nr:hypothetical protein J6590_099887 [Homalodisca vitripennis]